MYASRHNTMAAQWLRIIVKLRKQLIIKYRLFIPAVRTGESAMMGRPKRTHPPLASYYRYEIS